MARPNNITMGAGRLFLSTLIAEGADNLNGFRFIGNTPVIDLNVEVSRKDHFTATTAVKRKDVSIIDQVTRMIDFTAEDISPENVNAWMLGDELGDPIEVPSATGEVDTILDVRQGHGYVLGSTKLDAKGLIRRSGAGAIKPKDPDGTDTLSVTCAMAGDSGASIDCKENVDFVINRKNGVIRFLEKSNGGVPNGATVTITYDRLASTRTQIVAHDNQHVGQMLFTSDNPAGGNSVWWFPHCRISPQGTFGLINDDWQKLQFQAEVLVPQDETLSNGYMWTQAEPV